MSPSRLSHSFSLLDFRSYLPLAMVSTPTPNAETDFRWAVEKLDLLPVKAAESTILGYGSRLLGAVADDFRTDPNAAQDVGWKTVFDVSGSVCNVVT